MSHTFSKYFSNLAAPEPDEADFSDLQNRILNVLHVPHEDLFNFGSSMIDDMADMIVNDLLYFDEDQEEMFREIFSDAMQDINKRFQTIINNKIAFDNALPMMQSAGWEKIANRLNRSIQAVSVQITYAALALEHVAPEEKTLGPLDFIEEKMEWGEAELQEDLFQLLAPKFVINDNDVLSFIRYRGFSEDILDDVYECVSDLNLYSHRNVNQIVGVARISLGRVQALFMEEYDALSGGAKGSVPIPQNTINHLGKCIRNSINAVITNVSLAMLAAKDQKISESNLASWGDPKIDR